MASVRNNRSQVSSMDAADIRGTGNRPKSKFLLLLLFIYLFIRTLAGLERHRAGDPRHASGLGHLCLLEAYID